MMKRWCSFCAKWIHLNSSRGIFLEYVIFLVERCLFIQYAVKYYRYLLSEFVSDHGGRTSSSLPTSHTNPCLSFHQWAPYTRMKKRKGSAQLLQKPCLITSRTTYKCSAADSSHQTSQAVGLREGKRNEEKRYARWGLFHNTTPISSSRLCYIRRSPPPPPPSSKSQEAILISAPYFSSL